MKEEVCNLAHLDHDKTITCITHTGNPTTIDHLSFTLPDSIDLEAFLECSLNLTLEELTKAKGGRNGYHDRYYADNITVLTRGGAEGMGHNITLSGKACMRRKDDLGSLIDDVFSSNGHFTRCDLAIDDFEGVLNIRSIQSCISEGLVVSRAATFKEFYERGKSGQLTGRGAYFGSRKSNTYIRIYDKALQMSEDRHWVRVELELKKRAANEALKRVRAGNLGEVTKAILKDSLSFRMKGEQKNRSRWPVAPWWNHFLEGVERLRLTAPKVEDDASRQRRLEWFMSHARTFAEVVDAYGPTIIPAMYQQGKAVLAASPLQ